MSIKIHHGPPGSYKTSGAVMDDFIPAALAGRIVITNVRGLNDRDTVVKALGANKVPDTFDIIWIDTTVTDGREKLAVFFHWVPHGAFILIDEAQVIFPLAWKDKELFALDYPGGLEAATLENRPFNFLTAFEMHRHYGWDIVLTTPNIDKIRKDIRGCSEGAYKHKNQALIGFKGRYLEAFHLAEDNGKAASDFLSIRNRKIKNVVWSLYASTATGDHSDTIAGTPLWKNPRVMFFLVFLTVVILFVLSRPPPAVIAPKAKDTNTLDSHETIVASNAINIGHGNDSKSVSVNAVDDESPFNGYKWRIYGMTVANHILRYHFSLDGPDDYLNITSDVLKAYGYEVRYINTCNALVKYKDRQSFIARCKGKSLEKHYETIAKK